jgi:hypothetical protein
MGEWIEDIFDVHSIEAEICFTLNNDFYYGSDNDADITARKEIEVLALPKFARKVDLLAKSIEVIGNESALADYYEQIIAYAKKHKKTFRECQHYFWLRLWLWNKEADIFVSFPWSDTQSDFDKLIERLVTTEAGEAYLDGDQGWEIAFIAEGDFLFIRECDPDTEPETVNYQIKVSRSLLINQLVDAQKRSKSIIGFLSDKIGTDLWTEYSSYSPSEFPTSTSRNN